MRRRGLTIVELTIAVLVIGVLLASIGRLLTVVAQQQREDERRLAALHEAANHMERLAAIPWNGLSTETVSQATLSVEAAEALPAGELTVRISEAAPPADAAALERRRVEVAVTWRNTAGERVQPVRLVAWRYAEGRAP